MVSHSSVLAEASAFSVELVGFHGFHASNPRTKFQIGNIMLVVSQTAEFTRHKASLTSHLGHRPFLAAQDRDMCRNQI